jgi:hypothetical protein
MPASILVIARHVAFATYTSRDKETCLSTPNNSIWVSSTEIRQIQIQTRRSQLLITHINQGKNHMVSQWNKILVQPSHVESTKGKEVVIGEERPLRMIKPKSLKDDEW